MLVWIHHDSGEHIVRIGIVGSGHIGAGVARLWAAAGHEVMFSFSRDERKLQDLAVSVGPMGRFGTPAQATDFAEVILLAPPYPMLGSALGQAGPMNGKLVIDATNPYTADFQVVDLGPSGSAGEELAARLPAARVVKAFNTLPAAVYDAPDRGSRLVLFLCGDDPADREIVADLIRDAGFSPMDVGPLSAARKQEPLGDRYNAILTGTQAHE